MLGLTMMNESCDGDSTDPMCPSFTSGQIQDAARSQIPGSPTNSTACSRTSSTSYSSVSSHTESSHGVATPCEGLRHDNVNSADVTGRSFPEAADFEEWHSWEDNASTNPTVRTPASECRVPVSATEYSRRLFDIVHRTSGGAFGVDAIHVPGPLAFAKDTTPTTAVPKTASSQPQSSQSFVTSKVPSSQGRDAAAKEDMPKYMCLVPGCGKAFSRHADLQRHARKHSPDKPFLCGCCENMEKPEPYRTHRRDHLLQHLRKTHHEDSSDQCPLCPATSDGGVLFCGRACVLLHAKSHHDDLSKDSSIFNSLGLFPLLPLVVLADPCQKCSAVVRTAYLGQVSGSPRLDQHRRNLRGPFLQALLSTRNGSSSSMALARWRVPRL